MKTQTNESETMNNIQPHPLPVRILANMIVAPIAFVTAPLWLPFALYFEKRRNLKASQ